ncbi:OTU and/or ubiquitin domain containing protein [Asbolus verrucosus]|uniref:Ubiquitin thioesterase OTU n=1 Tax=Asbolus verrucosus TaxID=1661398 RepID=A0A482VER7_ASBVE|nr:OTU and/or ubiquitin domain containing protein [Asbolus verrucosus]
MSSPLALRIKTKTGQQVIRNLTPEDTIKDLKVHLSNVSNIPQDRLHVLSGFPPKVFDITQDNLSLSKTGLTSGDTLILEEKAPSSQNVAQEHRSHISENDSDYPGILMRKVVPADNSCLFSSIYFALNGKLDESGTVAPYMRQIIAETVSRDLEMFSEAILGKPNADYCAWIQDDKSWGGAIELAILSNHYGFEIAVVDTINAIINRFGEDQQYTLRIFLIFDGIHYDPLFLESFDGSNIQTIFPTDDDKIMKEAEELAKEAKSSRQFTDVNKFTLKCMVCNVYLNGQLQAREHAQSTGHMNFGEV